MTILTKTYYYQIYRSRWSLTKCLYLASRFGLLLGLPIIMYALLLDHDMESCKPFVVIVAVLFMLFVCPVLLTNSLLTLLTRPYIPIAMLCTMYIYPPCICNHRRQTLVIAHLSTLLPCLPLRHLPVFSERIGTLERHLSNIRQNWVF